MAYERTLLRTGGMKWPYCNGILKRWHDKNAHTPPGDRGRRAPGRRTAPGPSPPAPDAPEGRDSPGAQKRPEKRRVDAPGAGGVRLLTRPTTLNPRGGNPPGIHVPDHPAGHPAAGAPPHRPPVPAAALRADLYEQLPELREIDASSGPVCSPSPPPPSTSTGTPRRRVAQIRRQNQALQARRAQLLTDHGYEADCLDKPPVPQMLRPGLDRLHHVRLPQGALRPGADQEPVLPAGSGRAEL